MRGAQVGDFPSKHGMGCLRMCVVNLERLRGLWWCVPANGFTAQPAWFVACSSACFELSAQFAPTMTLQLHLLLVTFSTNRDHSHRSGASWRSVVPLAIKIIFLK
jgi:hypothetical protein